MFSRIEGIDRLVDEEGHDARSTLLRVATDLFVDAPSELRRSDIERYADLALPLLEAADLQTRLNVASRLSACPHAPDRVMERLLLDPEPCIVDEVIRRSCQMTREDLVRLYLRGQERHIIALAARHDLDAALVRLLAQHDSTGVLKALVENINAPLDADVTRLLVTRAAQLTMLAELLMRRRDIPSLWLAALYGQVDANARARLRNNAGIESGPPELPIPAESFAPLHKAAVERDKAALEAALARMLRLDPAGMKPIMQDKSGELLALALLAAGCEPTSIADIMRFAAASGVHDCEQTITAALAVAMSTTRKSARRIVSAVADERLSPAPLYQPHMVAAGTPQRGGSASTTRLRRKEGAIRTGKTAVTF